jgi:hypothetical protein
VSGATSASLVGYVFAKNAGHETGQFLCLFFAQELTTQEHRMKMKRSGENLVSRILATFDLQDSQNNLQ